MTVTIPKIDTQVGAITHYNSKLGNENGKIRSEK